jgi:hypothetical protein
LFRILEHFDDTFKIPEGKPIISSHFTKGGTMQTHIKDFFQGLEMGTGSGHRNLVVFPLMYEARTGLEYLSLDEALAQRVFEVEEVSAGGEVPFLRVTNRGKLPVLILAGEELVGAKQNRIVNTTILVGAQLRVHIPVSCVEQGRWRYQGKKFHSEQRLSPPRVRRRVKQDVAYSLKAGRGFMAKQGAVWEEIDAKAACLSVHSPTGAMADIYKSYEEELRDYAAGFSLAPHQKGLVAAVNGRPVGLEGFDSTASLRRYFAKLIQSYALDALEGRQPEPPLDPPEAEIRKWVEELWKLPVTSRPSLVLGEDLRLESPTVIGSGFRYEGMVLYLSAFSQASPNNRAPMARAGLRGSFHRPW